MPHRSSPDEAPVKIVDPTSAHTLCHPTGDCVRSFGRFVYRKLEAWIESIDDVALQDLTLRLGIFLVGFTI